MKRVAGLVGLAALACTPALAGAASAVPTAKPMLGSTRDPRAVGFGQVKPARLGFGKPLFACRIRWDSWGGQIAVGTGVGWAVNPETYKPVPSAVIIYLYELKTVQGKSAYTDLNFVPVPTQHAHPLKAC